MHKGRTVAFNGIPYLTSYNREQGSYRRVQWYTLPFVVPSCTWVVLSCTRGRTVVYKELNHRAQEVVHKGPYCRSQGVVQSLTRGRTVVHKGIVPSFTRGRAVELMGSFARGRAVVHKWPYRRSQGGRTVVQKGVVPSFRRGRAIMHKGPYRRSQGGRTVVHKGSYRRAQVVALPGHVRRTLHTYTPPQQQQQVAAAAEAGATTTAYVCFASNRCLGQGLAFRGAGRSGAWPGRAGRGGATYQGGRLPS